MPEKYTIAWRPLLLLLLAIWIVEAFNLLVGHTLFPLGILPRTLQGLDGILWFSFVHGSLDHAVLNTVPLVVLGALSATRGSRNFIILTLGIILIGGGLLWLLGRSSWHIGASLLVFGYFGCLLAMAWYERSFAAILTAILVTVFYSGMLWGVLPLETHVSWEGHLFGLLAGVIMARHLSR